MFAFDKSTPNVVPSRYRQVAIATDLDRLEPAWLEKHFVGREAYMRTRFIVARNNDKTALVEVDRPESDDLFSPIEHVRVLATPDQCRYVRSSETDVGIPSQLAAIAADHRDVSCVVVEGRYSHVSFLLNPAPLKLQVLDIVPPFPSKLIDQVQRVLDVAETLPPIVVVPIAIDSRTQLADECDPLPERVIVPCRGSGLDLEGVEVAYLDERPKVADWTLLGCERSHQIHSWFYNSSPKTVDICPKRYVGNIDKDVGAILTRCCLLQEGIEDRASATFVPWGSSLDEVREAIELVVNQNGVAWTPT